MWTFHCDLNELMVWKGENFSATKNQVLATRLELVATGQLTFSFFNFLTSIENDNLLVDERYIIFE